MARKQKSDAANTDPMRKPSNSIMANKNPLVKSTKLQETIQLISADRK